MRVLLEPRDAAQQRLRAREQVLVLDRARQVATALQLTHGVHRIREEAVIGAHQQCGGDRALVPTRSACAAASAASWFARSKSPPLPTIHAHAASARARRAAGGRLAVERSLEDAGGAVEAARARNQNCSARHARNAASGSVATARVSAASRFAASASSAAKTSGCRGVSASRPSRSARARNASRWRSRTASASPASCKPLERVLANGLQQSVPHAPALPSTRTSECSTSVCMAARTRRRHTSRANSSVVPSANTPSARSRRCASGGSSP